MVITEGQGPVLRCRLGHRFVYSMGGVGAGVNLRRVGTNLEIGQRFTESRITRREGHAETTAGDIPLIRRTQRVR